MIMMFILHCMKKLVAFLRSQTGRKKSIDLLEGLDFEFLNGIHGGDDLDVAMHGHLAMTNNNPNLGPIDDFCRAFDEDFLYDPFAAQVIEYFNVS